MALTNAGRDHIAAALIAESLTSFANANAHIAVGDSTTAFAATHTDLQAATNKHREPVDATYPTRSTNVLTFRATFEEADANFNWNEWGVFNAVSAGTMLNRKVESLGLKPSTASWEFTVTLTVTAA